jgi:integrase
MKKQNYATMFTLRSDGRYMGFWHELDRDGNPTGPRHPIYDRDPEQLYLKIRKKETPPRRTLKEVAGEWENIHRDEVAVRTWSNYAPHLEDIVTQYGSLPVADITAFDVSQDLQVAKARGLSHTVVNTRRSIWNGIFDYAISQRDIPYNPAMSVKLPKGLKKGKRTAPEDDVINAIILNADDMDFGFIPFFLLCTGVRRSEALQRKKSDINTKTWEMTIPKAKTDAGIRKVPIIQPLREPLKQWMDAHPGDWLFPHVNYNGHRGTYMSDRNWETAWEKYCTQHGWVDENGKPVIGAHNLRHGTATLLYEADVDLYTARDILGHANISTTLEIYTDLRKSHQQKNVGKFSRSMTKLQNAAAKKQKKPGK